MMKILNRKNRNRAARLLSLIMIMECVFCFLSGERSYFAAEDLSVIEINTADDFVDLIEKSGDGTYTLGKNFKLMANITLTGVKAGPVQTFGGVFDGNGHSITGYSYKGKLSGVGLFRSVMKGGEIRNLNLIVEMQPRSDMNNIGGIAGINSGTIKNCNVKGNILGKSCVGGIVGRNEKSGRIENCVNEAIVQGMKRTGGIAGYNEGSIISSENRGKINNNKKTAWEIDDERKRSDPEGDQDEGNENIEKLIPDNMDIAYDDFLDAVKDEQEVDYTGGIAGVNSGTVDSCKNETDVGYPHLGYKTGGIVGYERGVLCSSVNNGTVYGRKNTGGIVGQFEPYVRDDFSEDSFKKAQDESDLLVELITSLQDSVKGKDDNVQEKIDYIRGDADSLRDRVYGYKDYYRNKDDVMEQDMRTHTSAIRATLNGIDVSLKTGEANDALTGIQNDLDKIESLMAAAEKAEANGVTIDKTNYIGSVRGIASKMDKEIDTLLELAQHAGKDYNGLKNSASDLRGESNSFDDFLRNAYDSYKGDIRGTDDDLTVRIDRIADGMDALSDSLKDADKLIRDKMDGITESLSKLTEDINNGFDEARGELERLRNTKDLNDIYDDVSDDPDISPAKGKIVHCTNDGAVITDINGGGIAGMVDTDFDPESDFSVESSGKVSFVRSKTKAATIVKCRNTGAVTVKNDCAGGIAGNMDIGAVEVCENFGPVITVDGDYSGGIAGKSGFMIRDSFSMAAVSGNEYVGGIAGFGTKLYNNRALATISPGVKGKYGIIAGDVDEEKSSVSGNIYVKDMVGAVNCLTFEREARAVSFEDFMKLPGIPSEAGTMTVSFLSNGELLKKIEVPYGGSVSPEDYPSLGDEGERFGVWEDKDLSDVRQNTVVNAIYVTFATTIASSEPFPVILLSGKFHKEASVSYEKDEADSGSDSASLPEGYESIAEKYSFKIDSEFLSRDANVTVRLLADDYAKGDAAAVRLSDGSFKILKTERDGRYMVFPYELRDDSGEFFILRPGPDRKMIVIIGAAAAVLLIILAIYLLGRRKKKAPSEPPEDH